MELCVGGNLSDWIKEQKLYEKSNKVHEEDWAKIIKYILEGIKYIHETHELIHRDMKPGNILFLCKNDINSLKIWDFGLAAKLGIGFDDQNNDNTGTLVYQAPEQIKCAPYGKKVDIWAIGMIMYEILTKGGHPLLGLNFYHTLKMPLNDFKETMLHVNNDFEMIKASDEIPKNWWQLLENMLNVNPNNRYDAQVALKHPWITRDKNGIVPLSMYEEMQLNIMSYDKLKLIQRATYAMSIINDRVIKNRKKSENK